MTWKIEQDDRQPLTELDHVVRIPAAVDLARLMVPHMSLSAGNGETVTWTGSIADHIDEDLRYPSNPVDLIVHNDGSCVVVTTATFGRGALMGWIQQTLAQPMITQVPMRSCA